MRNCPFPFLLERIGIKSHKGRIEHIFHVGEERERCKTCQKIDQKTVEKYDRRLQRILKKHPEIM